AQLGINTTSYFPNTAVAWAVARRLRLTGAELKASRGRVAELARDNERIRHARILHDRVLQTLEALATGGWIADDQVRAHVATEATWLRGLVEDNVRGAPIPGEGQLDLLAALQDLVDRCAREGLRVELNASGLREQARWRHAMPAETASALVEATREVLTNVRKHAGVDSAVLRVSAIGDELTLSVLDNG